MKATQKKEAPFVGYVDKAVSLYVRIKELETELATLKDAFKENAKNTGVVEYEGRTGKITVSDNPQSNIDPEGFLAFLKREKQGHLFTEMVKVQVTKAVTAFGKVALAKITTVEENPCSRVTIKPW
jgi:hypothetical protein